MAATLTPVYAHARTHAERAIAVAAVSRRPAIALQQVIASTARVHNNSNSKVLANRVAPINADIFESILLYVGSEDYSVCALVCKRWNEAARDLSPDTQVRFEPRPDLVRKFRIPIRFLQRNHSLTAPRFTMVENALAPLLSLHASILEIDYELANQLDALRCQEEEVSTVTPGISFIHMTEHIRWAWGGAPYTRYEHLPINVQKSLFKQLEKYYPHHLAVINHVTNIRTKISTILTAYKNAGLTLPRTAEVIRIIEREEQRRADRLAEARRRNPPPPRETSCTIM